MNAMVGLFLIAIGLTMILLPVALLYDVHKRRDLEQQQKDLKELIDSLKFTKKN